ncbi:MAG: iron-containing alcohol dehydrogenase family protein [Spirochaetia bacterium]
MLGFESYTPTRILVGEKTLSQIGDQARRLGKKALLVTGRTSMKSSGYTARVSRFLEQAGLRVEVFDQVDSNPSRETVKSGGELATRAKIDLVVGLGGGSALDVAKGIALVAAHGGDIWDYVGGKEIPGPIIPLIEVPSTAGTGSEVTKYAVISDEKAHLKEGFASDFIIPLVAIIDAELMSMAPPDLTARAGGDALAQAIEAYLTKRANPFSDLLALEAIHLCAEHLVKATRDGKKLESRLAMGWASTLAGIAISYVDVVIGHHVSEAVGALFKTHHGMTAALLLPYAMEFNLAESKERLSRIAKALGENVSALSPEDAAKKAVDSVRALLRDIGIPGRLTDLGVTQAAVPAILAILKNRTKDLQAGNPKEITEQSVAAFVAMAL